MVIALARTGKDKIRRKVVNKVAQINKEVRSNVIPKLRIFIIVVIKLILPKIDLTPAKWREKITISTLCLEWNWIVLKLG